MLHGRRAEVSRGPADNDRDGPPQPLATPRSPLGLSLPALLVYQEPLSMAAWFLGWTRPHLGRVHGSGTWAVWQSTDVDGWIVCLGSRSGYLLGQQEPNNAPPSLAAPPPSSSPPFRPRLSWTDRRQPMINHVVSPIQPSPALSHPSQQHHCPISRISTCTYIHAYIHAHSCWLSLSLVKPPRTRPPTHRRGLAG